MNDEETGQRLRAAIERGLKIAGGDATFRALENGTPNRDGSYLERLSRVRPADASQASMLEELLRYAPAVCFVIGHATQDEDYFLATDVLMSLRSRKLVYLEPVVTTINDVVELPLIPLVNLVDLAKYAFGKQIFIDRHWVMVDGRSSDWVAAELTIRKIALLQGGDKIAAVV